MEQSRGIIGSPSGFSGIAFVIETTGLACRLQLLHKPMLLTLGVSKDIPLGIVCCIAERLLDRPVNPYLAVVLQ